MTDTKASGPQILRVIAEADGPTTAREVGECLDYHDLGNVRTTLKRLYRNGIVTREGSGVKNHPYRYEIAPIETEDFDA